MYRSTLYQGITYNIYLETNDIILSQQFPNHTKELVNNVETFSIELLHNEMKSYVAKQIYDAFVKTNFVTWDIHWHNKPKTIESIKLILDKYKSMIKLSQNDSESFSKILHRGRVDKTEVIFPIDLYSYDNYKSYINCTNIGCTGKIKIYKSVNDKGLLLNGLSINELIDNLRNYYDYDTIYGPTSGCPIFVDTWSYKVILIEGIARLACIYQYTRKYNTRKKERKYIYRYKHILTTIEYCLKRVICNSIKKRIDNANNKFSDYLSFEIKYLKSLKNSESWILWTKLNFKQQKEVLNNLCSYNFRKEELDELSSRKEDYLEKIYKKIIIPMLNLKKRNNPNEEITYF